MSERTVIIGRIATIGRLEGRTTGICEVNMSTRYIVYITELGHKYDSISYEEECSSLKDVVQCIHSLPSAQGYCGHVDKLTLIDGEWFSDTIMHF